MGEVVQAATLDHRNDMNPNENGYNIDLSAHMAECDANYLRVMKLFPKLRERTASTFAVCLNGHRAQVSVEVAERSRYTTVIRLRQSPDAPWGANPAFRVRLYHDARCAEVIEYQCAKHFNAVYPYPNAGMRQRDEKAQVNRLLGEFLAFCLRHGANAREPLLAME